MLIVLIALVVAVVCVVIAIKDDFDTWKGVVCAILGVSGILTLLVTTGLALTVHFREDIEYEKTLARKQAIEYSIDHREENLIGNELLFADVVSFNNNLREEKWKVESPWVNWFANDKIAEIDYIDYTEHD